MKKIIGVRVVLALLLAGIAFLAGMPASAEEPVYNASFPMNANYFYSTDGYFVPYDEEHECPIFFTFKVINKDLETLSSVAVEADAGEITVVDASPSPTDVTDSLYTWAFQDVAPGSDVHVVLRSEASFVVAPGYSSSRAVDNEVFTSPGTQTVTVTITPKREFSFLEVELLPPGVPSSGENDLVRWELLSEKLLTLRNPDIGQTYPFKFQVYVEPKVASVTFLPEVTIRANILKGVNWFFNTSTVSNQATDHLGRTVTATATISDTAARFLANEGEMRIVRYNAFNNPPLAEAGGPYLAQVDSPVRLDATVSSDPDGTIVRYNWSFGDGDTWTGTDATVEHIYGATGLYIARLAVIDNQGARGIDTALVVVYDPAAGFATGGGWFIPGGKTSYNDDYLPDIDGASPANFGFVVKYKPGATNLDGQLEFQYRQGDFNLHSSGMDWLFIVNKNWAKFKGIATIKGFEGFWPFRVDARDGDFGGGTQPDRFIIKVYEPGVDPDQSDPVYKASGTLEAGSIVIHAKAYEVTRVLRLQTPFPSGHPFMTPLENFAQAVELDTGGSVRIELYPGNALVPNIELAKAVKWGDVEMGLITNGWLAELSRVMHGGSLPFLYNDDDGLMDAVRGGIGDLMSQELKAHNITAIDWTNLAFAHLFHRTKMLAHPDDVVISDKIRAVGIQEAAVIEWGGTQVLMPPDQVYMALKDGKIGGAAFPLHSYDAYKLYDVARYFCVDYAFANLAGLCINSDVWNSLDAETQQTITTAAGAYVDEMLATVKSVDAAALDTIKDYGVEVYELSSTERADWRLASEPVWYDWAQGVGDVGQQILDIALSHNP